MGYKIVIFLGIKRRLLLLVRVGKYIRYIAEDKILRIAIIG
jgi:hypothetical protein